MADHKLDCYQRCLELASVIPNSVARAGEIRALLHRGDFKKAHALTEELEDNVQRHRSVAVGVLLTVDTPESIALSKLATAIQDYMEWFCD